jgi:hypothetical protein
MINSAIPIAETLDSIFKQPKTIADKHSRSRGARRPGCAKNFRPREGVGNAGRKSADLSVVGEVEGVARLFISSSVNGEFTLCFVQTTGLL